MTVIVCILQLLYFCKYCNMNTPNFDLNLMLSDDRDNIQTEELNPDSIRMQTTDMETSFGAGTVDSATSTKDVFASFFDEFPYMDELFNSFDEHDNKENKSVETPSENPTENDVKTEEKSDRHQVLEEDDLNEFSAANTEKTTKYATTWAAKTFKGKIF